MPAVPKPRREKCRAYLEFLKSLPCVFSGCGRQGIDPHHVVSRGAGGSDFLALPLCREHHVRIHRLGRITCQEELRSEPLALSVEHLSRFALELITRTGIGEGFTPEEVEKLSAKAFGYEARGNVYPWRRLLMHLGWRFDLEATAWRITGPMPWDQPVRFVEGLPGVRVIRAER